MDKKQEPAPKKSGKKKRKLSKYQKFISRCMKSKNIKKFGEASEAMKQCAIAWNQKKSGGDEASG